MRWRATPSSSPSALYHSRLASDIAMDLDSIPPITRWWAGSALALALAEHVGLVSSLQLFLSFRLVLRGQLWRIPTSLAYFGPFSVDFLFNLVFATRYSRMLEENHYAGHKADFVYLLLFSSFVLVALSPLVTMPFLGSPLGFVLVYLWSRRNRHVRLSLFGILVITAPYLPWALVAFSWILSGSYKAAVGDLMGIAVGHLCKYTLLRLEHETLSLTFAASDYFLVDVWPREVKSGGRNLLATPALL